MRAVAAEPELRVGVPGDVEAERVGEDVLVEVGAEEPVAQYGGLSRMVNRNDATVPLVMVAGQVVVRDGVPTSLVGTHRTGSFLRAGQRSSIPARAEASEASTASDQASLTATQVSA